MPYYGFEDQARKRILFAKDMQGDEKGPVYCPNPTCGAHMFLKVSKNGRKFLAANYHLGPHSPGCAYHICGMADFDPDDYCLNFSAEDIIRGICEPQKKRTPAAGGGGCKRTEKQPRSMKVLYMLCKSKHPGVYIGRTPIYTILVDNRTSIRDSQWWDGYRMVECYPVPEGNFYSTHDLKLTFHIDRGLAKEQTKVTVTFSSFDLFREVRNKFFDHDGHVLRHKLTVFGGKWEKIGDNHIATKISHKKQILIF